MPFWILMCSAAMVLSVFTGLYVGKCVRWCDVQVWRSPPGDRFSDGPA
jgi:hypothetical protein